MMELFTKIFSGFFSNIDILQGPIQVLSEGATGGLERNLHQCFP